MELRRFDVVMHLVHAWLKLDRLGGSLLDQQHDQCCSVLAALQSS